MKHRLMIVEDEAVITLQLQERLSHMGYEVVGRAGNGEEGLQLAEQLRPELILMDIIMPGRIDGIEAACAIRARLGIPVIFLTAYADDALIGRAKAAEPLGYILKPYQESEIKAAIELALHRTEQERRTLGVATPLGRVHLAVVLRSLEDGVITTDLEGRVVLMSRAAEDLTGQSLQQALGRGLEELIAPANGGAGGLLDSLVEAVRRGGHAVTLERDCCFPSVAGTTRRVFFSSAPISAPDRQLSGVVIIFWDKSSLEKKESELLEQRKLDSMGTMAEGIAHAFNNVLTPLMFNLDMAKLLVREEDKVYQRLMGVETASRRVRELIQRLVQLTRSPIYLMLEDDLAGPLRDWVLRTADAAGCSCGFLLDEGLWPVRIDHLQLEQAIGNLVLNAGEALLDRREPIEVRAQNATLGPLSHPPVRQGDYVRISIADRGRGIPPEHLGRIFDPFFTTKPEVGRGLGLSFVHAIIKRHGGYVLVNSVPGQGTEFQLYLPARP